ncbi:MAG: OadG family protein [Thermodesulfovibrionales bacterium]|nr:OadG family protein [Thermodesulfovibrionales bacterium]
MDWIYDLKQAVIIMVLGMGITFLFLGILILMIQMTSWFISKFISPQVPATQVIASFSENKNDAALVAAISIAVRKYHQNKMLRKMQET